MKEKIIRILNSGEGDEEMARKIIALVMVEGSGSGGEVSAGFKGLIDVIGTNDDPEVAIPQGLFVILVREVERRVELALLEARR